MKILSFTSLFPNSENPSRGVFIERRLRALNALEDVSVRVIAPIPRFPLGHLISDHHKEGKRANRRSNLNGLDVEYPRAITPPFAGMYLAPGALFRAGIKAAQAAIHDGFDFDLIDAHYIYPDGYAAMRIADELGKPLIISVRGSDVTELPRHASLRPRIIEVLDRAARVICVSKALQAVVVDELGISADKVHVAGNGVDSAAFSRRNPATGPWSNARDQKLVLSVGHLLAHKGHHLVIEALQHVEGVSLLLVGDGSERARLEKMADALGVADRVYFAGRVAPEHLAAYYSAADASILASSREGWANVLLESLACGTPVVASDISMNREVLEGCDAARLVPRTPSGIAKGISEILAARIEPDTALSFARRHTWERTADSVYQIFDQVL